MVQNRLLSWNPAEAKVRRFSFAPWAHPGVGAAVYVQNLAGDKTIAGIVNSRA